MIDIDWNVVAEKVIILFIGGGGGWLFNSVFKLRKDMNIAFCKIRILEGSKKKKKGVRQ